MEGQTDSDTGRRCQLDRINGQPPVSGGMGSYRVPYMDHCPRWLDTHTHSTTPGHHLTADLQAEISYAFCGLSPRSKPSGRNGFIVLRSSRLILDGPARWQQCGSCFFHSQSYSRISTVRASP